MIPFCLFWLWQGSMEMQSTKCPRSSSRMLNVSFLPLLFKVIATQSHTSHFDTDLNSPYGDNLFWTQRFKVNHSFPIAIFPEAPQLPLAPAPFFVTVTVAVVARSPFRCWRLPFWSLHHFCSAGHQGESGFLLQTSGQANTHLTLEH